MRIAIDARELTGQRTGVGRYVAELLAAWSELPGAAAHEFVLCAPEPVTEPRAQSLRITTAVSAGRGTIWEQLILPRLVKRVGADVLFAPAYSGPILSPVPFVVTIHDVSFAAHPEWFSFREGLRRRSVTRIAAWRSARILTVSDFSKREIVKHLGVDADKVEVIYSGATSVSNAQATSPRAPATPAVLFVGSVLTRRHVPELLDGFSRLAARRPDIRLDIVGDNRTRPFIDLDRRIAHSSARDRIRTRSYVSDAELSSLYAGATAFAFLSEYEGFGFTPLEALGAGIPIVVLDTEVAREIYGPAAEYVDSLEPSQIESALERVLFDEPERERLRHAATGVLERYAWRDCALRTLQMLLACGP